MNALRFQQAALLALSFDTAARVGAQGLSDALGHPVVMDVHAARIEIPNH